MCALSNSHLHVPQVYRFLIKRKCWEVSVPTDDCLVSSSLKVTIATLLYDLNFLLKILLKTPNGIKVRNLGSYK